ncbi:recombinational DNA repair protein (RecF pathway) [Burkholderiales bacterium JOSHI_001]|nr:recombinational DNA repair protein (RecF pathway) [Burkholderiales bacterium JOSHI_001]
MSTRVPVRKPPAVLQAYVLHSWDWSETSLVLDLFTREQGRVAVVAKGAKRPYSQLKSVLLPFQRFAASLPKPKEAKEGAGGDDEEARSLRGAEWLPNAAMLPPAALFSGFYLNELLMKLLPRQDANPRLFDAYAATLHSLALAPQADGDAAQAALRAFELLLLRETGVLPELDRDTATQRPVVAYQAYALRGEAGLVGATGEHALPGAQCLALQAALDEGSAAGLPALQQACTLALAPLKAQTRALLHYHLGGPELRTRLVARSLNRLLPPTV